VVTHGHRTGYATLVDVTLFASDAKLTTAPSRHLAGRMDTTVFIRLFFNTPGK
jgi:hypothetical protein